MIVDTLERQLLNVPCFGNAVVCKKIDDGLQRAANTVKGILVIGMVFRVTASDAIAIIAADVISSYAGLQAMKKETQR